MKTPILLLDNYDSFTYNLLHYIEDLSGRQVVVRRNDEIKLEEVDFFYDIVLSPGPGIPAESGILVPLIRKYAATKRIFGVCLGMQAIAEAFGGNLVQLKTVMHGISRPVILTQPTDRLFHGIPQTFMAGRYHSWVVDRFTLPGCMQIIAQDEHGQIMALKHKTCNLKGVQFHPESILTEYGRKIIENWLCDY